MVEKINDLVSLYQQKIGTYDKQHWERTVEKRVLKSIHNAPRKTVKAKPELIDVDLVRGSTFPKAKPCHGFLSVTRQGLVKVILLPLFFKWWKHQTNTLFTVILILCYGLQVATLALYLKDPDKKLSAEDISSAHVITPIIMSLLLGLIHAHIVATQEAGRPRHKDKTKTTTGSSDSPVNKKTRKSKSGRKSSGQSDHDLKSCDPTSAEVTGLRQRKFNSKTLLNRRRSLLSDRGNRSEEADDENEEYSRSLRKMDRTEGTENGTEVKDFACDKDEKLEQKSNIDRKYFPSQEKNSFQRNFVSFSDEFERLCDLKIQNHLNTEFENCKVEAFSGIEDLTVGYNEVTGEIIQSELESVPTTLEEIETYEQNPELLTPLDELDDLQQHLVEREVECDSGIVNMRNDTDSNSECSRGILEGAPYQKLNDPAIAKPWGHILSDMVDPSSNESCDRSTDDAGHKNSMGLTSARISKLEKINSLTLKLGGQKEYHASSAESESPITPKSQNLLGSELEWGGDANMSSCDDTSSDTSSVESRNDGESKSESTKDSIPHVAGVMYNLSSGADKVSCMIWEAEEVNKIDLTVLDIGWSIIRKVDSIPATCDYLVLGIVFSLVAAVIPGVFRVYWSVNKFESIDNLTFTTEYFQQANKLIFGQHWSEFVIVCNSMIQRLLLGTVLFFLLSVAERTFKQRLLYAKHFCYLTSSRRARKYEMPHFRLNKVRNIKIWFSLRSYLKKRGPQRSVDTIVSAAFILEVILISVMCFQLLQDSESFLGHLGNWELVIWCMALAIYLLRFMTLGTKINKKYRNFSVLITEQINLYLQLEQKPHKKTELMMANSVLKLAEALLKELEIPFKISGLSANPFLYNMTKVILLSAFSAVLTELLGFKLKLYKIKA